MNTIKNRKGFTLVEVLAVIVIIGILSAVVIPLTIKYINQGKDNYYKSLEKEVTLIARNYYTTNKNEFPMGQYDKSGNPLYITQVTIDRLKSAGLITNDVVDTDGNACTGYVRVENKNGEYEYTPCLICNDKYKSDNEYCFYNGEDSKYFLACNISLENENDYSYGVWTNSNVKVKITSSYKGTTLTPTIYLYKTSDGVSIKPYNNVGSYTITNSKDKLTVTAYDQSKSATCTSSGAILVDKDKPTCSMTYEITDTGAKIILVGKDKTSGVDYMIFNGKKATIMGTTDKISTHIVKEDGTYNATVYDKAGNSNTCSVNIKGLDKTPPTITFAVNKKVNGSNGAYGKGTQILVTCDDDKKIASYSVKWGSTEGTYVTNTTTKQSKTITLDKVGNQIVKAVCTDSSGNKTEKSETYKVTTVPFSNIKVSGTSKSYFAPATYESGKASSEGTHIKIPTPYNSGVTKLTYKLRIYVSEIEGLNLGNNYDVFYSVFYKDMNGNKKACENEIAVAGSNKEIINTTKTCTTTGGVQEVWLYVYNNARAISYGSDSYITDINISGAY